MSTKVAAAPANQAKQPVRSEKPAEQPEKQEAVQDEDARLARDDSDEDIRVSEETVSGEEEVQAEEPSLAGDFSFGEALADAAASSGSLISETEEAETSVYGNYGDGGSEGTILLIGAIILVGAGIVALASGGSDGPDVPLENGPPAFDAETIDVDINEDEPLTGDLNDVVTDPEGDALTFELVEDNTANGAFVFDADGSWTFTPDQDFNGDGGSIVVTVSDGEDTDTATINFTIQPVNDAPEFAAESADLETTVDTPLIGALGATDVDGDPLTFGVETGPANGAVEVTEDGEVTYTPNAGYTGTDTVVVNVTDPDGLTDTATLNITILGGPAENEISIDNDSQDALDPIAATDDIDVFLDDATVDTSVVIGDFNAMGEGDRIEVTNADPGDYFFGTGVDPNDLRITANSPDGFTEIILDDALVGFNGFVFDLDSAVDALGYEFITFG